MKRKKNRDFEEIEILKQKYLLRLADQEEEIKSSLIDLRDNITGVTVLSRVKDNLFSGSGLAFKLGVMAVTMLRKRMKQKTGRKS
jgi:hypothetical protein